MKQSLSLVIAMAIGLSLAGCGTLKKLTKPNDNTVLPGQREDILTPDQYKVEDATVTDGQTPTDVEQGSNKPCNPETDPNCGTVIDQEAGG
jgi:predicted small lipoprotein YifL